MATQFPLQASNGQQIISIPGGAVGFHTANLAFTQAPSAGSVTIEARTIGSAIWVPVLKATNLSITSGEAAVQIDGILAAIRVTFSSLVGGASPVLWLSTGLSPQGLFEGLRAITTQSYTEANVKNGAQFSASTYLTGLTAGEFIDVIVVTGAKKVLIKGQLISLRDSGDLIIDWYKAPAYTGGQNLSAGVYNQSDVNRLPSTVQLFGVAPTNPATGDYSPNDATKPNVSNIGTKIAPTLVTLGIAGQGSSQNSRAASEGLEMVLDANSTYLFRRTAVGATAAMFGFSTWFEGEPDFPL